MCSAGVCALKRAVADAVEQVSGHLFVAVSGGADSMALLVAAASLRPGMITALHCNFHLRGEESERDQRFVAALCDRLGVRLRCIDFDVAAYMRSHPGRSVEMACRELRYEWFLECVEQQGGDSAVLTGHNADDNAETFFLNLMRGSGLKGLGGIPRRRGRILRPLLSISRQQILDFLADEGETFIVDSTNLGNMYARNYVRNEVIPLLEQRWPQAKAMVAKSQKILRDDLALLEDLLGDLEASSALSFDRLKRSNSPRSMIYYFIRTKGGSPAQAAEMMRAIEANALSGKRWVLGEGEIVKERSEFRYYPDDSCSGEVLKWIGPVRLHVDMLTDLKNYGESIFISPYPAESYEWRSVARGDRMRPLGMKGSRLLSDMMKDAKWSHGEKASAMVLARKKDGVIVWAENLRRSREDQAVVGDLCYVAGRTDALQEYGARWWAE